MLLHTDMSILYGIAAAMVYYSDDYVIYIIFHIGFIFHYRIFILFVRSSPPLIDIAFEIIDGLIDYF